MSQKHTVNRLLPATSPLGRPANTKSKIKKATFTLLATIAIASTASALSNTGLDYGNQVGGDINSKLNSTDSIDTRLQKPLTTNTPLKTMDDTSQSVQAPFCGQGEVQNENRAIQVTMTATGTVTVDIDTNSDGNFDTTSTFNATMICIEGYQVGTEPTASWYTWSVTGSTVTATGPSTIPLNGCMSPTSNTATYAGGSISKKWAEATGKVITNSSLVGNTVTYYSGTIQDCNSINKTPTATKYYDNPYTMNDAAIAQSIICSTTSTDPACQAYASTRQAQTNVSGDGQTGGVGCNIERQITDSKSHTSDVICEQNRIYYPAPYTIDSPTCFKTAGDRWDYNQQFRFKCDQTGKELHIESWAWWEGAPCGSTSNALDFANYPPPYQLIYNLPYGGSSLVDTVIGKLSVNRRMGDNITYKDTSTDIACYSDDTKNPLKVHMTKYECEAGNASCTYTLTVENAPACSNISYMHVPPPDEQIKDDCTPYENTESCTLTEETWYDANDIGVKTIEKGASTNNQQQVYTASSPYNPIPTTCKTFTQLGQVCKEWWRKYRVYTCESKYKKYEPNLDRATKVMDSTYSNEPDASNSDTLGTFKFDRSSYNKENTQKCVLQVTYTSPDIANCLTNGLTLTCPLNYQYDSTDHLCTRTPNCNPYSYANATNRCEYDPGPSPICDIYYPTYDAGSNTCQSNPICDLGIYDNTRNRCETDGTPTCPSPIYEYYDPLTVCRLIPPPCPTNYDFSPATNRCEATAALCPTGVFNPPPTSNCVNDLSCAPDMYDSTLKKCYHPAGKTCLTDYLPDNTMNVCYKMEGNCDYGTWSPTYGKCTGDREYICPDTFDLRPTDNKCLKDPTCPNHNGKPIAYSAGCTTPKENVCQSPYKINATSTACETDPKCPNNLGSYVLSSNNCEYTPQPKFHCDANNQDYSTSGDCTTNCKDTKDCSLPFRGITSQADCCSSGTYSICGSGPSITVGTFGSIALAPGAMASNCVAVTWQLHPSVQWTAVGSGISISYNTVSGPQYIGTINITGLGNLSGGGWWDNGQYCGDASIMQIYALPQSGSQKLHFWSSDQNGSYDTGDIYSSLPAICPHGSTYPCSGNPSQCTKDGTCTQTVQCPTGYDPDGPIKCKATPICPDNQPVNPATGKCEKTPENKCLLPYAENISGLCQALPACTNSAPIIGDKCTLDAVYDCKAPLSWNGSIGTCSTEATCPSNGTVKNLRCETPFIPDCISPYTPDATGTKCTKNVDCAIGSFDNIAEKCILKYNNPAPVCPDSGQIDPTNHWCSLKPNICTPGMYYDNTNAKCWVNSRCNGIGHLDTNIDKCTYTPDKCMKQWQYDAANSQCYRDPTCPSGTMNYTKDRCEGNPTCGKTFYPEMDCEYQGANKTNLTCMSNDPIPDCATALKCPMGGALNGSICTATAQLTCTNPYTISGTDCTTAIPCPTSDTGPITVDYVGQKCTTPMGPRCTGGYELINGHCEAPIPCSPGNYDPATNKCIYTPSPSYKCSADNSIYSTQAACLIGCKGHISGGGDINWCGSWNYTVSASGNLLSIVLPYQLYGFTAEGTTTPIPTCANCGEYTTITAVNGGTQLQVKYGTTTVVGTITLYGATASGSLTLGNDRDHWDEVGPTSFIITGNQTCIHSGEWSSECYCGCSECSMGTLCFATSPTNCPQYTQCPGPEWNVVDPDCKKTPTCPSGGTPDSSISRCVLPTFQGCPIGYGVVNGVCTSNATCPLNGALSQTLSACRKNPTVTCPTTDYIADINGICTAAAQCPTGGKPSGGTEVSRKIYQKCVDPDQCEMKCAVNYPDATYVEGYRTDLKPCNRQGLDDTYVCQLDGGILQKDCACITETWQPSRTDTNCAMYQKWQMPIGGTYIKRCTYDSQDAKSKGGTSPYVCYAALNGMIETPIGGAVEMCCEPACTVTRTRAAPDTNSVVMKDYEVRQCTPYNNLIDAFICLTSPEETIVQDCQCVDQFGMTASIFSAIVETAKDRVCQP